MQTEMTYSTQKPIALKTTFTIISLLYYIEIQMDAVFFASIFVIVLHKIISCGAIYALTRKISDVFLQLLDLMMVKPIFKDIGPP